MPILEVAPFAMTRHLKCSGCSYGYTGSVAWHTCRCTVGSRHKPPSCRSCCARCQHAHCIRLACCAVESSRVQACSRGNKEKPVEHLALIFKKRRAGRQPRHWWRTRWTRSWQPRWRRRSPQRSARRRSAAPRSADSACRTARCGTKAEVYGKPPPVICRVMEEGGTGMTCAGWLLHGSS